MLRVVSLRLQGHRKTFIAMFVVAIAISALLAVGLTGVVRGFPSSQSDFFSSGSDESDGALVLTATGPVIFDPSALGLDPDGDNVYHFSTIEIGAGVTVVLSGQTINSPLWWLASGDVQIDGIIDLDG